MFLWFFSLLERQKRLGLAKNLFRGKATISPIKHNSRVFKAFFSNGEKRILKFYNSIKEAEKTRAFQEFARKKGIPTPKIYSIKKIKNYFFIEMEPATGVLALKKWKKMEKKEKEYVISQIAKTMVELHSVKPIKVLKKIDTGWKKRANDWSAFIREGIQSKIGMVLNEGFLNRGLAEKILLFLNECYLPKKVKPCIIHGDLWLENLFLDKTNKISAVIDWEIPFIGFSEYDVALTYYGLGNFSKHYSGHLVEEYESLGGEISEAYYLNKRVYYLFKCLHAISNIKNREESECLVEKTIKKIKELVEFEEK